VFLTYTGENYFKEKQNRKTTGGVKNGQFDIMSLKGVIIFIP